MSDSRASQKLSVVEKVGYSLGDSAANFIFQTMLMFLLSFYTDVFGIPAAVVGTLFLVARVTDAVFDFGMGAVADRTNTRWGKFRPWILWTAVPFGVLGYLTFSTPDLGVSGKIAYAYITYMLLMFVYSANNIPYSALMGVLTGDTIERTSLASYRFVAAMLATLAIQGLTLPLAQAFGQGDAAKGYRTTMGWFCAIGVVFFFITFFTTRERVKPDPAQRSSLRQDLSDLLSNRPWVVLFTLTVLYFLNLSVRNSATPYYFRYFVSQSPDVFALTVFGLPLRFDLFSLFNVASILANIAGIFFSKPLAVRFGKRDTFRVCLFIAALFTTIFVFLPPDSVGLMFLIQILLQLSYGVTIPLLWAMMADVADHSEWRTGRRATGIAFSATVFGLKFGLGIGGALTGWLLGAFGYVANVDQSPGTLLGIRLLMSVIPAAFFFLGVGVLFAYPIDRELERRIDLDLQSRRARLAGASVLALVVLIALGAVGSVRLRAEEPALKALVPKTMLIGAALNQTQSDGRDPIALGIITQHFNTISPENLLKWALVHPDPDRYDFAPADRYVDFGRQHGLTVIGHNLVWHQQTPAWVFAGADGKPADRDTLLARLRSHIGQVVGRYRGRIHGWDVVNEALNDDGTMRKSAWREAIGDDYVAKAFEFAHDADPDAELYYNDYNLWKPDKRAAAIRIVKDLQRRGLRVDGIGEQGHWQLETPTNAEIEQTIVDLAGTGLKAMLTEVDVDVLPRQPGMIGADLATKAKFKAETNLYPDGLPDAQQQRLARRYGDIFALIVKHQAKLSRVTFWGVTDAHSWLNDFPVPGRINYPLLWDRQGQPKPAFGAAVEALRQTR